VYALFFKFERKKATLALFFFLLQNNFVADEIPIFENNFIYFYQFRKKNSQKRINRNSKLKIGENNIYIKLDLKKTDGDFVRESVRTAQHSFG
jgi:hypothetical protein